MTKLLYLGPFLLAGSLVMATGCAVDDGTADTAETEQDVTSTILSTHTCNTWPHCDFDLGTSSNRTCVFAGLEGAWGVAGGYAIVGAGTGGENWLTIYPPSSPSYALGVTTLCVTPAQHTVTKAWSPNFGQGAQVQIPGTTASSVCFLSQVGSSGGMMSYNDSVRTWKDSSGVWWIGGSSAGFVDASATCFDATDIGEWSWGQTSGTITGNLASNLGGGVACGLAEIGGVFSSASTSDGVWINYIPRGVQWVWTFIGAKHAAATCIR